MYKKTNISIKDGMESLLLKLHTHDHSYKELVKVDHSYKELVKIASS